MDEILILTAKSKNIFAGLEDRWRAFLHRRPSALHTSVITFCYWSTVPQHMPRDLNCPLLAILIPTNICIMSHTYSLYSPCIALLRLPACLAKDMLLSHIGILLALRSAITTDVEKLSVISWTVCSNTRFIITSPCPFLSHTQSYPPSTTHTHCGREWQ